MKRLSSDIKVYIGLAVFVIICVIFIGRNGQSSGSGMEFIPRRTSYSAQPGGVKALYETLDQLGYPVRRQLSPLTSEPRDGVLFMISLEQGPSQTEWQQVRKWVERGNMLVVCGQAIGPQANPFDDSKLKPATSKAVCPSFLSPGVKSFCTNEYERISDEDLDLVGLRKLSKPFG